MESLEQKERTWSQGRAWAGAVIAVVGAVWGLGLLSDWSARFLLFHWHQHFLFRPQVYEVLAHPPNVFVTNEVPEQVGGDLTRLVGIPEFARRFEQVRPAGRHIVDGAGFRNFPAPPDFAHPIVVAGDSFMGSGEPMTNMFAARLADISGLPVHNRAMPGVGPFLSLIRFVDSERFRKYPPKVLVWGFIEREAIRHGFSGMVFQLESLERGGRKAERDDRASTSARVMWGIFSPTSLRRALPDTSVIAAYAYQVWNRLRYAWFGMITPDVFVSSGTVGGQPLLFLRRRIKLYDVDTPELNRTDIADAIRSVKALLARQKIALVVVLIPDKETVYRDLIPAHIPRDPSADHTDPDALAESLRAQDITVVNLLPVFREHAAKGELLYWPDDTHWNERGVQIAAEETWKVIRALWEEQGQ